MGDPSITKRITTRALVARGVLSWIFAVALVATTAVSAFVALSAVVLGFGLFTFVSGAVGLYAAYARARRARAGARRAGGDPVAPTLQAAAGIGVAIVTLAMPGLTALVLAWLVALYAVVTGAIELVSGSRRPTSIALGLTSIAFGILLLVLPVAGAYALSLLIAAWAFAMGAVTFAMAWKLGRYERWAHRPSVA